MGESPGEESLAAAILRCAAACADRPSDRVASRSAKRTSYSMCTLRGRLLTVEWTYLVISGEPGVRRFDLNGDSREKDAVYTSDRTHALPPAV